MNPIRVLLAEDQTIIRDGLRALLETYPDMSVVGWAANGMDAYAQTRALRPDVVLMDIRMPGTDGVEATRLIKTDCPETVVLVLTTFDDDEYIIKAMTYGAAGYLLKDISSEKLVEAIRDGLRGNIILPGRVAAKLAARLDGGSAPQVTARDFTPRETDIIRLLLQGRNNREIAGALYLSIGTVKNYLSQIYLKVDARDRAGAVLRLQQLGF